MAEIEINILGTTAGIPTRQRAHPAIYLIYRGEKEFCFLFDCGEGTQRQIILAGLNLMKINDIFITHLHGDHYLGIFGLIDTMNFEDRERALRIYTPEARKMSHLLNILNSGCEKGFEILMKDVPIDDNEIVDLLRTDEFKVVATPVEHTVPAVAYGLIEKEKVGIDKEKLRKMGLPLQAEMYREIKEKGRIQFKGREIKLEDICVIRKGKKIVYSGDTRICHNLIKLAQNADLLIQDCTYFNCEGFEEYEHTCIEDLIDAAGKIKAKKIILTHISRRYQDPAKLREIIKDYPHWEIAEDLMKVKV